MSFRGKKAGHFGGPAFVDSKGCPGVLVMCMQGKEEQALREATSLFSDYTRRVYPALFPSLESAAAAADAGGAATEAPRGDGNTLGAAGSTTVADEIAAELAELAGERVGVSSGVKRRREGDTSDIPGADRVAAAAAPQQGVAALASTPVPIRTAMVCRAMGILWFPGVAGASIDPCAVVNALCADLLATRQQCSRFIDRLVPLQRIVRSDMEEVLAATRDLLGADIAVAAPDQAAVDGSGGAPAAEPSAAAPRTWCAEVRVRNTDTVSKSLLTSGLGDIMRRRFRVDLERGSHTIVVEACMSIAGVSVVREAAFWRFSRYNGECVRIEREPEGEVMC